MFSKIRLTCFFATFSFALQVCAQDFRMGYIVKTGSADTVFGFVSNRSAKANASECLFKTSKDQKPQKYSSNDLVAYGVTNYKQYVAKKVKNPKGVTTRLFVEVIVRGELSLYKNSNLYYLEKKDSVTLLEPSVRVTGGQVIVNTQYIGALNYYMVDCRQDNNKVRYEQEHLTKAVINYNKCRGAQYVEAKALIPKSKFKFNVYSGLDWGSLSLQGMERFSFVKSTSVPIGLGVNFSLPRINDKLFASVDVFFDSKVYQVYNEFAGANGLARTDFLVKLSYVKLPIGVQYCFSQNNATMYVKGGFMPAFLIDFSGLLKSEIEQNGAVTKDLFAYNFAPKNPLGFWLGTGYQMKILPKTTALVEMRYELQNGFTNPTPSSKSSGNNISLLFGLTF